MSGRKFKLTEVTCDLCDKAIVVEKQYAHRVAHNIYSYRIGEESDETEEQLPIDRFDMNYCMACWDVVYDRLHFALHAEVTDEEKEDWKKARDDANKEEREE